MKKIIIGIMSLFAMYVNAFASPASLSAKSVIKGGEELRPSSGYEPRAKPLYAGAPSSRS